MLPVIASLTISLSAQQQFDPPISRGLSYPWMGGALDKSITQLVDDFFPGGSLTLIGQLFWGPNFIGSGFCASLNPSPSGHPGVVQCQTSATSGDQTNLVQHNSNNQSYYLHLGATGNDYSVWELDSIIETDSTVASTSLFSGASDNFSQISFQASNAIGVYYDTASHSCSSGSGSTANLVFIVRASGTDTCFDSGIAVAANTWYGIRIYSATPGTIKFQVSTNGGAYSASQTLSTNVPTAPLAAIFGVATHTAAARNLYIDWMAFVGEGLTR